MNPAQNENVRIRFAPSPTGFLHIGGVRTALFCWLFARQKQGQFLLRIEDTDLERSEERFTVDIQSSLKWLGLTWDEEPLFQSQRIPLYLAKARELVERGQAYYCTCSEDDVEKMREKATAEGKKPMYDRRCRGTRVEPQGKPYVIRTAVPLEGFVEWDDLIRGTIRIENSEVDDFVIIRSNGAPTYNLSVVVDDVESRMTHVVRGEEHTTNTPKQIHLYRYFGYTEPKFGHLPVILAADKKKLSKRHGAVSTNQYRADGYLPEALLNFLARLGWSHGDQELFTVEELIQFFDWKHVQKAGAVFNPEKLLWINGEHLKKSSPQRIRGILVEDFINQFPVETRERLQTPITDRVIGLLLPKVKLVRELVDPLVPLLTPGVVAFDGSGLKWNKDPTLKPVILKALEELVATFDQKIKNHSGSVARDEADRVWGLTPALGDLSEGGLALDSHAIHQAVQKIGETHGLKLGDFTQPLRLAVTGRSVSAGLFDLMAILPWDFVRERLKALGHSV